MANKENIKLTPALLKEQSAKLDAVQEFVVAIGGEDYILTHDVVFRKSKQHKVLDDMVEFFNEGGKQNIGMLDLATPYTALLIIKHFTSLEVSDNIEEALDLLTVLVDLEALDKIVNALPEDEVTKVYELLTMTIENFKNNLEEAEKEAEALALENADVLGIESDGESDSAEQTEQE